MGSRKKSKSSSSSSSTSGATAGQNMSTAMSKLPPATAESTTNMYNNLLGGQLGVIGETLGGLIEHGQNMMADNPGMANFMRAVGGQPMQFETPQMIKDLQAKAESLQAPAQPAEPAQAAPQQQMPPWASQLTPQQYQRYQNMQQKRGQYSPGQFNINDYMRSNNLGSR